MKVLIASDIHGSSFYAEELQRVIESEKPDIICLLGDFLYSGPRNPVREDYNPKAVVEILNHYADKIIAVRGNCDADIDLAVLNFALPKRNELVINNRRLVLLHGDDMDLHDAQIKKGNIVLYGHTHRPQMAWADGVLVLNPGSLSFPKEGYPHTYILMDEKEVQLRDLAGRTLEIRSL
ncbi:MAG: phosphodiesterase [Bacilli bacterium]|jgi:hypothetical protein|nr:phosphodiesterase [Bacilli bacterium]